MKLLNGSWIGLSCCWGVLWSGLLILQQQQKSVSPVLPILFQYRKRYRRYFTTAVSPAVLVFLSLWIGDAFSPFQFHNRGAINSACLILVIFFLMQRILIFQYHVVELLMSLVPFGWYSNYKAMADGHTALILVSVRDCATSVIESIQRERW